MTFVCPSVPSTLRAIVSVKFDQRASPEEIDAFKNAVIACPLILHSVELTGAFDFMVEAAVPDMTEYDRRIKSIAEPLASLVSRFEASFVCKHYFRKPKTAEPLWVECDDGLRRIEIGSIDRITAEGDYMRIHSNGDSWLIHATMHALVERLPSEDFIQLHRSTLVRNGFVERIYRENGHWVVKLDDGSHERVAKSKVPATLVRFRVNPATAEAVSSNKPELVDDRELT
jgi:DNA-binding LytR/AlgR family response regulator